MKRKLGLGIKRAFDVAFATIVLILSSPVLAVVAVLIRLRMGKPIFYKQERIGHRGKTFTMLKFRTMTEAVGPDGNLLPDEGRLTSLGQFLRSSTLDEVPELINVLRGEMSIVGPRALLASYRDLYSPDQWRRHEMPPGMAGPVLAGGRNALSWDEKFALDTWYVDNWSLRLDMRILRRTFLQVVRREGIAAEGHATFPPFEGSAGKGPTR